MTSFLDRVVTGKYGNERERIADYRAVFYGESTPEQGQRVLADIMRSGGVVEQRLPAGLLAMGPDAAAHYRNGTRALALEVFTLAMSEIRAPRERAERAMGKESEDDGRRAY